MYLRGSTYYKSSQQCARRNPFLLLLQPEDTPLHKSTGPENTYAVVRKVALQQFGHFMMGRVNLGGVWYTVSGSYGNDGLPMTVKTLPKDAVLLPRHLYDAWNKGGGWNGTGSEASVMAQWAKETFLK